MFLPFLHFAQLRLKSKAPWLQKVLSTEEKLTAEAVQSLMTQIKTPNLRMVFEKDKLKVDDPDAFIDETVTAMEQHLSAQKSGSSDVKDAPSKPAKSDTKAPANRTTVSNAANTSK